MVDVRADKRVDFHFNALLDAVTDWKRTAPTDENLEGNMSRSIVQIVNNPIQFRFTQAYGRTVQT